MPITLWTGLPGNGKTLNSIKAVKEQSEKENRPVFYSGIKILDNDALPWTEIEAEKWYEAPEGSIVFIDECQRVFRPRMHGKEPPKHVVELETHRHRGIDIHLVTQHPMLADNAIRRLTDRHLHVVRTMGMERCTIHEWPQVRENCEKPPAREDSIKHLTSYPKEVYNWYKSAEVHTMKRRIPAKLYMLIVCGLLLPLFGWLLYGSIMARVNGEDKSIKQFEEQYGVEASRNQPGQVRYAPPAAAASDKPSYLNAEHDAKQYLYERTPRIVGLGYTAPIYDEITKPVKVAMPAMCVQSGRRCQCYSQQGTKLDVGFNQCVELAHEGYFEEFDADGRNKRELASRNAKILEEQGTLPLSGANTTDRPIVMGDGTGYGVLGRRDAVRTPVADSKT